jgi:Ca-activated chloride channel family protein
MVSFEEPRWLWLLVPLVPFALLEWRGMRAAEARLARLVGGKLPHPLLAQRLPGARRTGLLLRQLALACLIVGASGPEWGVELVRRVASGSDIVFTVDVSASMDARDVPPSRIEEARREALSLLERLGGSRVGVVAFAGDAVRLCPLTLDRGAVRLVIESLTSGSVSEPGTDLGRGLRAAARMLPAGRRAEQAIVVWTDGEDLEQGARDAIAELGRRGVRVFAVGVGTPAGDVVPVLDEANRAVDIKRDASGGAVRSRLDESLLRDLARRTRGGYFSASRPGGESLRLLATLGGLERSERGQRLVERAVPRFPLCAALAAVLLAWDLVRRRRRENALTDAPETAGVTTATAKRGRRARAAGGAGAAATLALALVSRDAVAQTAWARGDRAFAHHEWAAAESLYARRLERWPRPEVGVNHGTAMVRAGRRDEGERELGAHVQDSGRTGQMAAYNLGTLQAETGRYDEALRALRTALERDPNDADARFNYEWTLQRMRRPPEPQKKGGGGDKKPQQKQPSQPQSGAPQQQPSAPQPQPQSQGAQAPQPQTGPAPQARRPNGMDQQQADRILGSLEQLERIEQQRIRRVRVLREKRGRDW